MIKQDNEIVRALAIQSFVKVPDAPLEGIIPYLKDDSQKVRLATVESLSGKVADIPSISESFIKIAELDSDPLVRLAATLGLGWGNIDSPAAIKAIEDNLHSENLSLGQASALALGRINSPATLAPLTSIALDYEQDRLLRGAAIAGLDYKFSYQTPVNIEIDTPEHKKYWTDQLAYSAQMPIDYKQMEISDNKWKDTNTYPDQEYYRTVIDPIKNHDSAEVAARLDQIVDKASEEASRNPLERFMDPFVISFFVQPEVKLIDNLNNSKDEIDVYNALVNYTIDSPKRLPVLGDVISRMTAIGNMAVAQGYSGIFRQGLVSIKNIRNFNPSLNSDIPVIMPNYQEQIYIQQNTLMPNIVDAWQQKNIIREDSLGSIPSSIQVPELDNIMRDANKWSNMAIPPGGTGFNPKYMSTPPPGLERSFPNFIPPGVTRFDSRYMSTPPPNSVYVGPNITGGAPYTGGSYIAPSITYSPPTNIINNYQRQLQLQRDLQQFNIPKTPIIDTFKNYHSPNIMHQFPNINRICNPPPVYNPPPIYIPPTPRY